MKKVEHEPLANGVNEHQYSATEMNSSLARLGLIILWCVGLGGLIKFSESVDTVVMLKLIVFFILAIAPPVWMLAQWRYKGID